MPAQPRDASVRVTGVSFAYGAGHDVLHGVDIELGPASRSPSSASAAPARRRSPSSSRASTTRPPARSLLGGASIAQLGGTSARRTVGLITQEVHAFAGPLADDLRLARPQAGDDELEAALERVGALGWVRALPDGLSTVIGRGGHRIGTAQAQQLALARLVLADPPIAVLDEATAEAGSAGARTLEKAAARALEGRTALIVAHRLTQAVEADRIVVLDGGRVRESGTHAELVAAGGAYAELWGAWTSSRAESPT